MLKNLCFRWPQQYNFFCFRPCAKFCIHLKYNKLSFSIVRNQCNCFELLIEPFAASNIFSVLCLSFTDVLALFPIMKVKNDVYVDFLKPSSTIKPCDLKSCRQLVKYIHAIIFKWLYYTNKRCANFLKRIF